VTDQTQPPVEQVLKQLPKALHDSLIICPLCGSDAYPKGLRAAETGWSVVFVCPQCGLLTPFKAVGIDLDEICGLQGSPWAAELRSFAQLHSTGSRLAPPTPRHLISVFMICFLLWVLLTWSFVAVDLLWGGIVSFSVALVSQRFSTFELSADWMRSPRRWLALLRLFLEFSRQLIIQNITLSIRVFRPKIPIKPGIVAVPTRLRGDAALTLLGSLTSLTPDTVTMEIEKERGMVYLHWIDVQTTDTAEAQKILTADLENHITNWLGNDV
jgi:multicomponent Na+:H+ antiporter subunit E